MGSRFRTLGTVSLEGPDGRITGRAAQHRRLAVLSYLAVAPSGTAARDKIVGLLWPETEQGKARHLLSDAVYALRKALGEESIESAGDEELRLDTSVVWSDVGAFAAALEADDIERAVGLYRGPFLDGFHVRAAPLFQRWKERQASRLGALYGEALERLAGEAEAGADLKAAVRWWQRRAAHDPYDSRVAHALMTALAAAGNPAAALRHARIHTQMLGDELGLEPSPEIREFVERLREGGGADPAASGQPSPGDAGTDAGVEDAPEPARPEGPAGGEERGAPAVTSASAAPAAGATTGARWTRWAVAALVLGLAGLFGWTLGGSRGADPAPARLVLSDVHDHTADSSLGPAVTEAIRIDLAQSTDVALAAPGFVRAVLERMRRDPDAPLTAALAREVAVREGLAGVIAGTVRQVGSSYLLAAEVIEPQSGRTLAGVRQTADRRDELIAAMDSLSKGLRRQLGEQPTTLNEAVPLARATTPSLEALERYSRAARLMEGGGRFETVRGLLEEAIALDSTFALAYRKLSSHLGNGLRDPAGSVAMARQAYRYREGLPDRERWLVEAHYHRKVAGDDEKAIAAIERLLTIYPDSHDPGVLNYLGNIHRERGELERAAEYYRRSIEVDSLSSFMPYWNLSLASVNIGELDAAERAVDAYDRLFARRSDFDGPPPSQRRMAIAAARRDYDRAMALARHNIARSKEPFPKYFNARMLTYFAAAAGRIGEAKAATREAVRHAGQDASSVLNAELAMAAVELRAVRDTAAALRRVRRALDTHPLDELEPMLAPYFWTANILASAGRPEKARRLIDEHLEVQDPEFRPEHRAAQRSITRARIALAEGDPGDAIERLRPLANRIRLDRGCWDYVDPCPLFSLAVAYEMAGQNEAAIAGFERFLYAPFTLSWLDAWLRADGLERLAALYLETGQPRKAAKAYRLLVELWKDADPELRPRVERARQLAQALSEPRQSGATQE